MSGQGSQLILSAGWVDCGAQQDLDEAPQVVHKVWSVVCAGDGGQGYDGVHP